MSSTTTTTTFINPSLFSHSTPISFPSPAPSSSYIHDDEDDEDQPSRKRARTSSSSSPADPTKPTSVSDQRKEARAHRNRIAAQNSRDRRKAQFGYLERRVAELEEENRILRAAAQLAAASGGPAQQQQHHFVLQTPSPVPAPIVSSSAVFHASPTMSAHEEQARAERERENQALKERIRTLEEGWGAVVKALAAQGLPMLQAQPAATAPETVAAETKPTTNVDMMAYTAFPSPAPSNASLDFDATLSASSSSSSPIIATTTLTPTTTNTTTNPNTTRHLAAGGLDRLEFGFGFEFGVNNGVEAGAGVSTSVGDGQGAQGAGDAEGDVEALLREILAEPRHGESEEEVVAGVAAEGGQQLVVVGSDVEGQLTEDTAGWTAEIEMQRMLDGMAAGMDVDFGSLAGMDMGDVFAMGLEFGDVGVF